MQFTKINKSRHAAYVFTYIWCLSPSISRYWDHASFGQCATERFAEDFGAELKECDGEADHVHMLIEVRANGAAIGTGELVKSGHIRRLRNEFWTWRCLQQTRTLVTLGLRALAAGAPLEVIKQYDFKTSVGLASEIPSTPTSEGVPFRI